MQKVKLKSYAYLTNLETEKVQYLQKVKLNVHLKDLNYLMAAKTDWYLEREKAQCIQKVKLKAYL